LSLRDNFLSDYGLNRIIFDDQTGRIEAVTQDQAQELIQAQLKQDYPSYDIDLNRYIETPQDHVITPNVDTGIRVSDVEPQLREYLDDLLGIFDRSTDEPKDEPKQPSDKPPKEPSENGIFQGIGLSDILADFYAKLTSGLLHLPPKPSDVPMKDRGSTLLDTLTGNIALAAIIVIGAVAILKD